jgi:hypothetical protein
MNIPRPTGPGLHGRQESNLQPSVLETDTLPVELRPYEVLGRRLSKASENDRSRPDQQRSAAAPGEGSP